MSCPALSPPEKLETNLAFPDCLHRLRGPTRPGPGAMRQRPPSMVRASRRASLEGGLGQGLDAASVHQRGVQPRGHRRAGSRLVYDSMAGQQEEDGHSHRIVVAGSSEGGWTPPPAATEALEVRTASGGPPTPTTMHPICCVCGAALIQLPSPALLPSRSHPFHLCAVAPRVLQRLSV